MRRLPNEDGWVLVTAMILMALMLSLGIATLGLVDRGQKNTREDRERESALNLGEGVLYAQGFAMRASTWPGAASTRMPERCQSSDASTPRCPNAATLSAAQGGTAAQFSTVDNGTADPRFPTTWATKVRDDYGVLENDFDPTQANATLTGPSGTCPGPCTYDFDGDKALWVQAHAIVRGKPRNVVAKLKLEEVIENTPKRAVVAGGIDVANNGNHGGTPIIDGTGNGVSVRCDVGAPDCLTYEAGQIVPLPQQQSGAANTMTAEQLTRLKDRAIKDNRYYPGCPTRGTDNQYHLEGAVVWIESCDGANLADSVATTSCSPPNGMADKCVNDITRPGTLVWHCGVADVQGGFTYVGLWYVPNNSDGTCGAGATRGDGNCDSAGDIAMATRGGFGVWGALNIDGAGCLDVGSNGLQVKYDANVWSAIRSYGTVGLVQNTWRELDPQRF
jgi:hypothetical protein